MLINSWKNWEKAKEKVKDRGFNDFPKTYTTFPLMSIKIKDIIEELQKNHVISDVIGIKNSGGEEQYYFVLHNGTNGRLTNCRYDILEVSEILRYLTEEQGVWSNLVLANIDIPDDIYSWLITFTNK